MLVFVLCRTKALVLELLAAVCLVSGGHDIILSAFDNFKEVRGFPVVTCVSAFGREFQMEGRGCVGMCVYMCLCLCICRFLLSMTVEF